MKKVIVFSLIIFIGSLVIVGGWSVSAKPKGAAAQVPKADLSVRYMFSGLTDDGQKGSASRKEATSILCTNTDTVNNQIYVELYQWSGTRIYTATVSAIPMASYTFSTQNTTIYFDDVIFGTGGGTDSIFQGSAIIYSDHPSLICTAEVLDPLGYPPVYMDKLAMHDANGYLVGTQRRTFLPLLHRK